MYTILFVDEHYDYNSFNFNILNNSCIVYTRCFDTSFLSSLYIRGITTIYVYKTYKELTDNSNNDNNNNNNSDNENYIEFDVILTGSDDFVNNNTNDLNVYNYKIQTETIDDFLYNILQNEENTFHATQSYENIMSIISENEYKSENNQADEENQENNQNSKSKKFQKTMDKEAKKMIYARNKEKYKQEMNKTSLSNRKSMEKLAFKSNSKQSNNTNNTNNTNTNDKSNTNDKTNNIPNASKKRKNKI